MNQALSKCGYSEWAFKIVKEQIDQKDAEPKKKRTAKKDHQATKTSVTIPYIKGLSEVLSHVLHHHGVATTMKPNQTLWRSIVHLKDKCEVRDMAGVVYQIPYKDCPMV